jgi:hypothetical protein
MLSTSSLADDRDRADGQRVAPSPDVARPWLYVDDPTIPAPLHVVASLGDTYSGNDRSVTRAFASADDGPGAKVAANAQLGLARMLALDVTGVVGGWGSGVGAGAIAAVRFAPFDGARHGFRLAIESGWLLDLDRASGVFARASASYAIGRVRLAVNAHVEHVFRDGADAVDVFATAGVSVRVAAPLRLGLEYVVQDLEEAWSTPDATDTPIPGRAESGVHQFLGANASLELLRARLFFNVGPALAFRPEIGQVAPVGRAVVLYSF